jgi:competence protein ComFA
MFPGCRCKSGIARGMVFIYNVTYQQQKAGPGEAHSPSSHRRSRVCFFLFRQHFVEKGAGAVKAWLYAVEVNERRTAYASVAWELDRRFWSEPAFRRGAAQGWGESGFKEPAGEVNVTLWMEPLPLGVVLAAYGRLVMMEKKGDWKNTGRGLREAVAWAAKQADGRMETGGGTQGNLLDAEAVGPTSAHAEGMVLGRCARELAEKVRGRSLLQPELIALREAGHTGGPEVDLLVELQLAVLLGGVRLETGVGTVSDTRTTVRPGFRCRRCGSRGAGLRRTACASCGRASCAYCETCLTMGRSRECGLLVNGWPAACLDLAFAGQTVSAEELKRRWGLSAAQGTAAAEAMRFLGRPRGIVRRKTWRDRFWLPLWPGKQADDGTFLLWAVTGAGKTEMMFPMLDAVLARGGRAAVASPRRDVVLELAPRLAAAFPNVRRSVLYGGSSDRWEAGDLTLATAHQLIRFREAFDLVVIDEVDAFPYHNDPALHYAAAKARRRDGTTVLLSATPPPELQRLARRRRLSHARVAVRHHRHPLPVPRRLPAPGISDWLVRGRLPARLRKAFHTSAVRGAQIFVFVPYIRQIDSLVHLLRGQASKMGLDPEHIDGTSSQDPRRGDKVSAFRRRELRLLVTTTILERGVTIPGSDVYVLDADKPLFDASSLVQMAGRAGRSADDPDGVVYFSAAAWTESQRDARRQIRSMNAFARKQGFLVP